MKLAIMNKPRGAKDPFKKISPAVSVKKYLGTKKCFHNIYVQI